MADQFTAAGEIRKVSDELGLVFGYAVVCRVEGQDHYDLHGDHIPEAAMLKAATDFMLYSRVGGDMHEAVAGTIVHSWPLTEDVAKAFGLEPKMTGWMIAFKPDTPEMLAKFKSGEYKGFSIGGRRKLDQDATSGQYLYYNEEA